MLPHDRLFSLSGLLALAVTLTACVDTGPPPNPRTMQAGGAKRSGEITVKKQASLPPPSSAQLRQVAKKYFSPLPAKMETADNPMTEAKVALGRALYYDTRLSKNHDVSCNTCHLLNNFGVDGKPVSTGHRGQTGDRNSPTVFNAALQLAQFWDGREPTVEAQALGPLINPVEMAQADHNSVIKTVASIPGYVDQFKAAFPDDKDPVNAENLGKAIGAFERGLTTPAAFDRFLQGDDNALSDDALRGLQLFVDAQCVTCHTGPGVGGTMYQKVGVIKPVPGIEDEGRIKITQNPKDKFFFKVPILRNVTKTAPYRHDGKIKTLDEMLDFMATYQIAKGKLSAEEKKYLTAFLQGLEGEVDPAYIAEPELPPSGPNTPKPDPT